MTIQEKKKAAIDTIRREVENVMHSDEEKLNMSRRALVKALAYDKLAETYGANANFEEHSMEFDKIYNEIPNDPLNRDLIGKQKNVDKIFQLADDTKLFAEKYNARKPGFEAENEVKENLRKLADKNDFKGMLDYCCSFQSQHETDPLHENKTYAIQSYFEDLTENKTKKPVELGKRNAEILKGFYEEYAKQSAQNAIDVKDKTKEIEQKIKNGAYAQTKYVDDDPRAIHKLADGIAHYQTAEGLRKFELDYVFNSALRGMPDGVGRKDVLIDGKTAKSYWTDRRLEVTKEQLQQKRPEYLQEIEKLHGDERRTFIYDQLNMGDKRREVKGYTLKQGIIPEGESPFESIPKNYADLEKMTNDEILREEQKIRDYKSISEKGQKAIGYMAAEVKPLADELDRMMKATIEKETERIMKEKAANPDADAEIPMPSKEYLELRAELENFQKFGTTKFKLSGPVLYDEGVHPKDENKLNSTVSRKALSRLEEAAKGYAKENPEFAEKVNAFVWEKRQQHATFLNPPYPKYSEKEIGKIKEMRGISKKTLKPDEVYAEKMKTAAADHQAAAAAYKNAKLTLRGSKEFNNIGKAMEDLEDRLARQIQLEKMHRSANEANTVNVRATMQQGIQNVLDELNKLKACNAAYYAHKVKDGQWKKGTNENADKRIEAVQKIDAYADKMIETFQNKLESIKPVDLNKKVDEAQKRLSASKNKLAPDSYPNKEQALKDYAIITTAAYINTLRKNKHNVPEMTTEEFNNEVGRLAGSKLFTDMVSSMDEKMLFERATADKGQRLFNEMKNVRNANLNNANIANNNQPAAQNEKVVEPPKNNLIM